MTPTELYEALAEGLAPSRADAEESFRRGLDVIKKQLLEGESVPVTGFGKLYIERYRGRFKCKFQAYPAFQKLIDEQFVENRIPEK